MRTSKNDEENKIACKFNFFALNIETESPCDVRNQFADSLVITPIKLLKREKIILILFKVNKPLLITGAFFQFSTQENSVV